MGIHSQIAEEIEEVDVIIAGGGTAGCIIASRLAEASPELSILVIEHGRDNYNQFNIVNPALFLRNLEPSSASAIFYKSNKAEQLAGRELIVPAGGVLGGGSSINFMMYTRAQQDDFDAWNTPGWSSEELKPFLNKFETYHGPGDDKDHGFSGPIHVSGGPKRALASEDDFMEAANRVGYPEIQDLQNLTANDGFSRWLRYVSPDGKRQDTAHTYLHPKLQDEKYPGLLTVVQTTVVRVLIDENTKRAAGVECVPNASFQALSTNLTQQPKRTVRARKLVVLSCGACGTPAVLERSGVGDAQILQRAGIPLVVDLPGVGHDYQDHNLIFYPYKTSLAHEDTIDTIISGRDDALHLAAHGDGRMGWNAIDVAAKIRPTGEEVASLGPEFQAAWDKDFKHAPNRPLMLMALISCYLGNQPSVPPGQYVSIATYTAYPYSRGRIHATGPDVADSLDFDVGFFSDAHDLDVKKLIWAYKKQREIMRRTKMYRGEFASGHPQFAEDSKAKCVELDGVLDIANVRDLEYSAEDDAAIELWLRENVGTTWHSLGTAKMAPRDGMGVVQPNLDVYGVAGLKVADLSIAPANVGANTNNTALMIGEKAADIIIQELKLSESV